MEYISHETESGISLILHLPYKRSNTFLIVHEQDIRIRRLLVCIDGKIDENDRVSEFNHHFTVVSVKELCADNTGCSRRPDTVRHAQCRDICRQQAVNRHAVTDKRHFVTDPIEHGRSEVRVVKFSGRKKSNLSRPRRKRAGFRFS